MTPLKTSNATILIPKQCGASDSEQRRTSRNYGKMKEQGDEESAHLAPAAARRSDGHMVLAR
ncbi:hypothetical protein E2562_008777 [Oryza meyeriana var. granulata]|uniref:Uncharacterized protein n=1 Tax=Oryza meyeriana var. granulata TaxID=110450 RepID=A0A6G1CZY4_9ORYZ|nr:hypothetical protein E2562_008777 [Oryza meyeriana var. granulata]